MGKLGGWDLYARRSRAAPLVRMHGLWRHLTEYTIIGQFDWLTQVEEKKKNNKNKYVRFSSHLLEKNPWRKGERLRRKSDSPIREVRGRSVLALNAASGTGSAGSRGCLVHFDHQTEREASTSKIPPFSVVDSLER